MTHVIKWLEIPADYGDILEYFWGYDEFSSYNVVIEITQNGVRNNYFKNKKENEKKMGKNPHGP